MAYKPNPTLTTKVGEARSWTVDTQVVERLDCIAELLERIHQQLVLVTGADIGPGKKL